jgi:hypothetical protein
MIVVEGSKGGQRLPQRNRNRATRRLNEVTLLPDFSKEVIR